MKELIEQLKEVKLYIETSMYINRHFIADKLINVIESLTSVKSKSVEEIQADIRNRLNSINNLIAMAENGLLKGNVEFHKLFQDELQQSKKEIATLSNYKILHDFANAEEKKQHAISFIKYIDIWHSNRKDISYDDLYEQYIKDYNEYLTTLNNK